jgi:hypothetical protein
MITKILNRYHGFNDHWFPEVSEKNLYVNQKIKDQYSIGCRDKEKHLLEKYKSFIPKGWYGFGLGEPLHTDWYNIIEEFLDYLISLQNEKKINGFEIHQIKLKFGGIRFCVSYKCKDEEFKEFLWLQIKSLEDALFDSKLIY